MNLIQFDNRELLINLVNVANLIYFMNKIIF